MTPLPKRKYAKARQGERRQHLGLISPVTYECPQCHSPKLPHRVCKTCGYYNGKEVIEVGSKPKKTT